MTPFVKVSINPNYTTGFVVSWDMSPQFNDRYPWIFVVDTAPTPDGEWTPTSPQLVNVFNWAGSPPVKVNKSAVLYFRVRLKTGDREYVSHVVQPYGDLTKREFLIARDIMRREVLAASRMAGVPIKVLLKANWGERCHKCTDPITGRVRNSNCPECIGTGFSRPYHGPYELWATFTPDSQHQVQETQQTGNVEQKVFQARVIGNPVLKHNDIVIDTRSGKRYYATGCSISAELRRIPIVQDIILSEAALTDPAYRLDIEGLEGLP